MVKAHIIWGSAEDIQKLTRHAQGIGSCAWGPLSWLSVRSAWRAGKKQVRIRCRAENDTACTCAIAHVLSSIPPVVSETTRGVAPAAQGPRGEDPKDVQPRATVTRNTDT